MLCPPSRRRALPSSFMICLREGRERKGSESCFPAENEISFDSCQSVSRIPTTNKYFVKHMYLERAEVVVSFTLP